jgi:hypothetical protein
MRRVIATFVACVVLIAPAAAKNEPVISNLALQQMQARDYEVGKAVSFPSVMTVLQDSGYRIESADKDTGLITGVASTTSKTTYNFFWGMGKKKRTPIVSAFVEDRGQGSRIRLNFVLATTKSRIYGVNSSDEVPVTDPAPYRDAFERIEKEIFVRQAMTAPTPKPLPVQTIPTAVQPPAIVPTSSPAEVPSSAEPTEPR